jgi:DNA-binding NarL/FixJ family response regulator
MTPYGIMLADDHVLFRRGVKKIIERTDGLEVVGEANDGLELLELLKQKTPALVILDISMPNLRGLEAAREIKVLYPWVKILLLTMHKTKKFLQQGLEAGVDGFLVKEDADTELLQAIRAIKDGGKFYSPLLSTQLAELVLQKGKTDPPPSEKKRWPSFWQKGKATRRLPTSCISVCTPSADTGPESCASWN